MTESTPDNPMGDDHVCIATGPRSLREEMLALLKEARIDAQNDRDQLYDSVTDANDENGDMADAAELAEVEDFIGRLNSCIERAEQ